MVTDISKKETQHRMIALLKFLLPSDKRHSFFANCIRSLLIGIIFVGIFIVPVIILVPKDNRTPEQIRAAEVAFARQKRLEAYQELLKDFPCVKLDDEPVAIQLEWLQYEVRFAAPKTYSFTGPRFSQPTIVLSRSELLAAEEYANHLFVQVPVKVRMGYSPEMIDSSVYISIPKRLVPEDFQPRSSGKTAGE